MLFVRCRLYSVKADGTDQKVKGHPYYDTIAVREVDARTVQITAKLGGKPANSDSMSVSADGATLTETFQDMSGAQDRDRNAGVEEDRSRCRGLACDFRSWKTEKVPDISDVGATTTYKMTPDGLQMSWNGQSYDAKFDGKKYLTANDPGKTWVSLAANLRQHDRGDRQSRWQGRRHLSDDCFGGWQDHDDRRQGRPPGDDLAVQDG